MTTQHACAARWPSAAALALAPALAAAQGRWETTVARIERGEWNGPRLPDGQPDIEGHWSNTVGNHDNFTDPHGGIPGDIARAGGGGARAIGTVERPAARAPSRVSGSARRPGAVPAVGARRAEGSARELLQSDRGAVH